MTMTRPRSMTVSHAIEIWAYGIDATGASVANQLPWIERDAATGRDCLKLPLPEPATLDRIAQALGTLAAALRR